MVGVPVVKHVRMLGIHHTLTGNQSHGVLLIAHSSITHKYRIIRPWRDKNNSIRRQMMINTLNIVILTCLLLYKALILGYVSESR